MIPRINACLCIGMVLAQPVLGERRPGDQRLLPTAATTSAPSQELESEVAHGSLPGIVQPAQRVELIAPSDGILSAIPVREGQRVTAGQVLAQLDDAMAQATVRVAQAAAGTAEVKLATVDLKLAQAELKRMLSVPDRRALAEVELDRAKAAVERAGAAVDRAKQANLRATHTLDVERERLQQLSLKAPFDGVVVRISTQRGASVVRATPLITVANLSTLKVELFADLKHFATLKVGHAYLLHAMAPVDGDLVGRLVSREPIIDAATRTFRCVFEIPNIDNEFPAGFTVQFSGAPATTSVVERRPRAQILRTGLR